MLTASPAGAGIHKAEDALVMHVLGDQVALRAELPGTRLAVIDILVPPGSGVPPHTHEFPEIFRILEGSLEIYSETGGRGSEAIAGPGDIVTVASGAVHGYRNPGQTPARAEVVVDQALLSFFRDIAYPAPLAGPPTPELMQKVFAAAERHGIDMLQDRGR